MEELKKKLLRRRDESDSEERKIEILIRDLQRKTKIDTAELVSYI
jgi:hypothetical protein